MSPTITAFYAGVLALIFIFLSMYTIRSRRIAKVSVLDGGNMTLARAMRVHGNFAEYVPMVLILMALGEMTDGFGWFLHLSGLMLVAARICHAVGLAQKTTSLRTAGTAATLFVIMINAFAAII